MTNTNTRGVLYIVWDGEAESQKLLGRSTESLQQYHPDLPIDVVTLDPSANLLDKARMLDLSPFDTTLFLDADTVVMGDLSFGFDKAEQHGIACCICECPWAKRYAGLSDCGDITEWNTGVIFFSKRMKPLFDRWQERNQSLDSQILFHGADGHINRMPLNDQCGFAAAVEDLEVNPWTLPLNWNYRPSWHRTFFGGLKIWHDMRPVPDAVMANNEKQRGDLVGCVEVRL